MERGDHRLLNIYSLKYEYFQFATVQVYNVKFKTYAMFTLCNALYIYISMITSAEYYVVQVVHVQYTNILVRGMKSKE